MSFITALGLSLNNIKTKKGRTLLTSFAASIGIIGISLVLALSNGFQKQIDNFEKDTLSNMPILILKEGINMSDVISATVDNDLEEYPDDKIIRKEKDVETVSHSNKLDDEYLNYLNNIDSSYLSGMSYSRYTRMNMLVKNGNTVELFDYNLSPLPETKDGKVDSLMIDNYDLLAGKMAEDSNDIMLIV